MFLKNKILKFQVNTIIQALPIRVIPEPVTLASSLKYTFSEGWAKNPNKNRSQVSREKKPWRASTSPTACSSRSPRTGRAGTSRLRRLPARRFKTPPPVRSPGLSVSKGGDSEFFTKPPTGVIHFLTFGAPNANFILVLTINGTTRSVVLVNTTGPTVLTELLLTIGAPSTVSLPDVQPCQGSGSVFLLAAGDGTGSLANVHTAIHRSDNGALFLSP